jgi:hypothetical protein
MYSEINEKISDSNIPILIEFHDWARLPEFSTRISSKPAKYFIGTIKISSTNQYPNTKPNQTNKTSQNNQTMPKTNNPNTTNHHLIAAPQEGNAVIK